MKRVIPRIVVALIGLIIGAIVFFPWNTLAQGAAAKIAKAAADSGIWLTTGNADVSGVFSKSFTFHSVKADFPLMKFSADKVVITPALSSVAFSKEKKSHISMGRGTLLPVTQVPLDWNGGNADITLTEDSLRIENISITGKLTVTGFAEISRNKNALKRAKVRIKVPAAMDKTLDSAAKMGVMPLKKIRNGMWRLEK